MYLLTASRNRAPQPPPYVPPQGPVYQAPPPAYSPPQGTQYGWVPYNTFPTAPPRKSLETRRLMSHPRGRCTRPHPQPTPHPRGRSMDGCRTTHSLQHLHVSHQKLGLKSDITRSASLRNEGLFSGFKDKQTNK